MRKVQLISCLAFVSIIYFGCSSKQPIEYKNISIELMFSVKYNISNNDYIINYKDKKSDTVKFKIPESAKKEIIRQFKILVSNPSLFKETQNSKRDILDKCSDRPKLYTFIHFEIEGSQYEITIDESCENYLPLELKEANEIKKWLHETKKILYSLEEIINAPESNITYM